VSLTAGQSFAVLQSLAEGPVCRVEISPLVLHERGVIDAAELRQQLGLAGGAV